MLPNRTDSKNIIQAKPRRKTLLGKSKTPSHASLELEIAVNPLIAAAGPLLDIASRLREQKESPDLKELQHRLEQEITVFENRAHERNYSSQMILAARYLICSLIDEIVLNSSWGKHSFWSQQSLLNLLQGETHSGEHFFLILERSAEDPKLYLDVLELGYVCISMGFQGPYRNQDKQELYHFTDNLYELVTGIRGEFNPSLSLGTKTSNIKSSRWRLLPPVWLTLIITLIILTLLFMPYYRQLQKMRLQVSSNNVMHTSMSLLRPMS